MGRVDAVVPPVQLDSREVVSPFYVRIDRVEHLQDAQVAFVHIHRHRVAVEAGIESAQCVEEALRRFEGLRLDRESSQALPRCSCEQCPCRLFDARPA